jgi:hypothetical protein
MSVKDDQIDVDIEIDEAPKKTEGDVEVVKVEGSGSSGPVIEPQDALREMKEKYERERDARLQAERRANEANQAAFTAQSEVQENSYHLVTNAIATVTQTNEILKANYREAMSLGDYDRAADLQSEMSTNAAKLLQLEQGKQSLEAQPKQSAPQPYVADPVEAMAAQLSPRSAAWVRAHPEYATDQRLFQKMLAAHNLAVADDIPVDSDDYFAEIENTLRIKPSTQVNLDNDPTSSAAQVTQRRSAPPAAPVSRSGTGTGSRPNVVRLNSDEREMAKMMGMTDQEYARNKLALQKEGKLH